MNSIPETDEERMERLEKEQLLALYADIRRAQRELVASGNADLLPTTLLGWGQLSCELRHRRHVPDCEMMEALAYS